MLSLSLSTVKSHRITYKSGITLFSVVCLQHCSVNSFVYSPLHPQVYLCLLLRRLSTNTYWTNEWGNLDNKQHNKDIKTYLMVSSWRCLSWRKKIHEGNRKAFLNYIKVWKGVIQLTLYGNEGRSLKDRCLTWFKRRLLNSTFSNKKEFLWEELSPHTRDTLFRLFGFLEYVAQDKKLD